MADALPASAWREERVLRGTVDEIRPTIAWVLGRLPGGETTVMLDVGLTEALTNAVAHGVNGLASAERDVDYRAWLDRLAKAPGREAGLRVTLTLDAATVEVRLRWKGTPYVPEELGPPRPDAVRGRGTTLIGSAFDEVEVDADGLGLRLSARLATA